MTIPLRPRIQGTGCVVNPGCVVRPEDPPTPHEGASVDLDVSEEE